MKRFKRSAVSDYGLAQSILGLDFIRPEEVTLARPSIVYTVEQIKALAESLPSEDVLKWCKDNSYAVIPSPPADMSTLDVREVRSTHFYSRTNVWRAEHRFAHEDKTPFGWSLIKKRPVSDSTNKTWSKQSKLLPVLEKVPNAAEMCWFITTYLEVRGVRLFEGVYVRTSSINSEGDHVVIGNLPPDGLDVNYLYWDDYHLDFLGLAAGRNIEACPS